MRAERKCGELLGEMDKNTGAEGIGTAKGVQSSTATAPKTLSEMGMAKGNQHVNSAKSNNTTEQTKTLSDKENAMT